jgi:hypothetical protein
MDDVVKVVGWIIAGAVVVHLLSSTQLPTSIDSITKGFSGIIASMLGQGGATGTVVKPGTQGP